MGIEIITLGLSNPTRLNPARFERWERQYIATHSFEEMWDDAFPTGQPGCRYNRVGRLWLERTDLVPLSGSHRSETGIDCHAEQTLIEGEPKFEPRSEVGAEATAPGLQSKNVGE